MTKHTLKIARLCCMVDHLSIICKPVRSSFGKYQLLYSIYYRKFQHGVLHVLLKPKGYDGKFLFICSAFSFTGTTLASKQLLRLAVVVVY